MKHKSIPCAAQGPLYPNAADSRYFAEKSLEILTALFCGSASVTAMLLLLMLA